MSSAKKNILLNSVNTVTGILFPVVTFPYAARILMPEGIGTVSFFNTVIDYIILLTSLGIPLYAVREIAKHRDNTELRNRTAAEILCLAIILCVVGYVAVWLLATFYPRINSNSAVFYVLSLSILFNAIGANWFYQGIEDFKFITVRAIIVRIMSAAALFLFVRDKTDILIYAFIIVGSTAGNNVVNFFNLRHSFLPYIRKVHKKDIIRHLRPSAEIFSLNLIISLYIQVNVIMLGAMSSDAEVGYYAAGMKVIQIGLLLISSIGTVLIPRCSNLVESDDKKEFERVVGKSLLLLLAFSLPAATGIALLARPVIHIFCGSAYIPAVPVLLTVAPVIVIVSIANVTGMQVLYPNGKVGILLASASVGAFVSILLNILLIPAMGAMGAAVSYLAAESTMLAMQMILGRRHFPFRFSDLMPLQIISATFLMGMGVYFCTRIIAGEIMQMAIGTVAGLTIYFISLAVIKNPVVTELTLTLRQIAAYFKSSR